MNVLRLLPLVAVLVVFAGTGAIAQTASVETGRAIFPVSSKTEKTEVLSGTPYRFHKKLPQLFSGYAIEVAASNYPLDRANPIFRQFGNVHYEKLREGGYSYLILGSFSSKDSALHFVQTIIKPKAEKARLFEYKDGIRKAIRE